MRMLKLFYWEEVEVMI